MQPMSVGASSSKLLPVIAGSRTFPRDWSLKTKVRFVSSGSFSWCTSLRGVDRVRTEPALSSPLCHPFTSQTHCLRYLRHLCATHSHHRLTIRDAFVTSVPSIHITDSLSEVPSSPLCHPLTSQTHHPRYFRHLCTIHSHHRLTIRDIFVSSCHPFTSQTHRLRYLHHLCAIHSHHRLTVWGAFITSVPSTHITDSPSRVFHHLCTIHSHHRLTVWGTIITSVPPIHITDSPSEVPSSPLCHPFTSQTRRLRYLRHLCTTHSHHRLTIEILSSPLPPIHITDSPSGVALWGNNVGKQFLESGRGEMCRKCPAYDPSLLALCAISSSSRILLNEMRIGGAWVCNSVFCCQPDYVLHTTIYYLYLLLVFPGRWPSLVGHHGFV